MSEIADLKFWFMHDNHTFSELKGDSIDEVIDKAKEMAKKSLYGSLCPASVRNTTQRIGKMVFAQKDEFDPQDLEAYKHRIERFCKNQQTND